MRLKTLYEEFRMNPHRPPDRAIYHETRGASAALYDILTMPSRVSVVQRLLTSIVGTISQITIDSPIESDDISHILGQIDNLRGLLSDMPDASIPDNILMYIGELKHTIDEFCLKYKND